jgi:tryptophan synthase alpha chain
MALADITDRFRSPRAAGTGLLLPFVTGGYPSLAATEAVLPALADAGAGVIEVGIPFSDPIADGPVIASSMHDALQTGATPEGVFKAVARVGSRTRAPIVGMVSDSIVGRMGAEPFARRAADSGFSGLIVPDVDLHEAPRLREACAKAGLSLTLLVAPTTGPERARRIVAECTGFVYALARVGITGERAEAPDARALVERLRTCTTQPIAVGFGISTREHVRAVWAYADGAIVGSSLVRRMQQAVAANADPVAAAAEFTRELAGAAP